MLDQPIYRGTPKKQRNTRLGLILMAVSGVFALGVAITPRFIVTRWIYGVFGIYLFALLFLVFFIGLAIHLRRKYHINRRYIVLSSVLIFCVFTAIHIAFTAAALDNYSASFGEYLAHHFSNITPGGVIFGIASFILGISLTLEGAFIVLGIGFIIAAAFLTSYIITMVGENKVIKKLPRIENEFEPEAPKKPVVDLHKAIDEKYQELLEKQSRRNLERGKSELGLTAPPPTQYVREATYDEPIPLTRLEPEGRVTDQINAMSTEAAARLEAGLGGASGPNSAGLYSPLYTSFGPDYTPKIPNRTPEQPPQNPLFHQPQQFQPYHNQPGPFNNPLPPSFNYTQPIQPAYQDNPYTPQPPPPPAYTPQPVPQQINIIPREPEPSVFDSRSGGLPPGARQTDMGEALPKKPKIYKRAKYSKPSIDLIRTESTDLSEANMEAVQKQYLLDSKLKEFGVNAKVTNFTVAPAVTRFEIQLATGTRVSHVTQLENDIAYVLGSQNVRIETTIEGKNAIGVEVPNKSVGKVSIKDILGTKEFMQHKSPLAAVIGKNISDECVVADITTMPHLLIAGSTGSGKSVMLNTILTSLLYRAHPDDVKLLLVDMKRVELNMYNEIPHMLIPRAIKEVQHTINALKWMQTEMTRRYDILEANGVNNIALYQSLPNYQNGSLERMPYILMVIDEAADLLAKGKKEVEDAIKSLSALARACGIHIILATQRPSVDVITAVIKTNFPVRIAFKVGSRGDSQTIINDSGAEKLVGRGDMLFIREGSSTRIQSAFIELEETRKVMNFIRENNAAEFDTELEDLILNGPPNQGAADGFGDADAVRKAQDPYFVPILKWIVREDNFHKTVSISNMQRQFSLGFSRAGKIIDQLTQMGYVSAGNGSKARDVLVSRDEVERLYGE